MGAGGIFFLVRDGKKICQRRESALRRLKGSHCKKWPQRLLIAASKEFGVADKHKRSIRAAAVLRGAVKRPYQLASRALIEICFPGVPVCECPPL
jgi:hypothetical protein